MCKKNDLPYGIIVISIVGGHFYDGKILIGVFSYFVCHTLRCIFPDRGKGRGCGSFTGTGICHAYNLYQSLTIITIQKGRHIKYDKLYEFKKVYIGSKMK